MGIAPAVITAPIPGSQVGVTAYGKPVADDINQGIAKKPMATLQSLAGSSYPNTTGSGEAGMTSVVEDTDSMTNIASSNKITIRTPGLWTLRGGIGWAANATGYRSCEIFRNGGAAVSDSRPGTSPAGTRQSVSITLRCQAGDQINLMVGQNSGAALNAENYSTGVWLQAVYEGA